MSDISKKRDRQRRWISKLFIALAVAVIAYNVFFAGFNAAHHWYQSMGIDLIIAAFWLPILWIWNSSSSLDKDIDSLDREIKQHERFLKTLEELAEAEEKSRHDAWLDHQVEVALLKATKGGGKKPNKRELEKIESLFHEATGRYVRLAEANNDGGWFDVSDKPFDEAPGRTPAHEAARKRGDANRVKLNAKPAVRATTERVKRPRSTK